MVRRLVRSWDGRGREEDGSAWMWVIELESLMAMGSGAGDIERDVVRWFVIAGLRG